MTKYDSGRRFEWRVKKILEAAGAVVVRSAGSKGKADLVALWPEFTWAVQCKTYKPTAADRADIIKASGNTAARWALVWSDDGIKAECFKGGKPWKVLPPGLRKGGKDA